MVNEGLGSWPVRRAQKTPERAAYIFDDQVCTYGDLERHVRRVASGLRGLGIGPGDRVAFLGTNSPVFVEVLFASAAVGAIFVPVNARLSESEIAYILSDCGAGVLVVDEELWPKVPDSPGPTHTIVNGASDDAEFLYSGFVGTDTGNGSAPIAVGMDDPCLIMYTSGTTGHPKGAVLTHGNLTWNCINMVIDNDVVSDDVHLVVAPLFHVSALCNNFLPAFLKGGTAVLLAKFEAAEVLRLVAKWGITYLHGVPTIYQRLAAHPDFTTANLNSVRRAGCGGSAVDAETIATYQERGIRFTQGYGMTETGPGVLYLSADKSSDKLGAVGVPHFFVDCEVRDEEDRPVGPGGQGEVVVRSRSVMREYWNKPSATESAFDEQGYFRSGDVARIDEDGYLYIIDRIKDMVISGGENIYPSEIEAVVSTHPEVLGSAVIGVPDAEWGEVCHLVVERRLGATVTEDELLALVRSQLAGFKVPKFVTFVDGLPRTATGKIIKSELRSGSAVHPSTPQARSRKDTP